MSNHSQDRLNSWARFLNAVGNFSTKLIWSIIGIIIIAALGRFLYMESQEAKPGQPKQIVEVPVVKPIPWHEVDKHIMAAMRKSYDIAEAYAKNKLAKWTDELQQRIDDNFLNWYFSYWQQQWIGLKAMGYWIVDHEIVEKVIGTQQSMAERITAEIQEEFSKRVSRPQIAQLRIERIADSTVQIYVKEIGKNLSSIPQKYNISQADWNRHLSDIALITGEAEGNREVSISLKTLMVSGAAGGTVASVKVSKMLKPMITKIGGNADPLSVYF